MVNRYTVFQPQQYVETYVPLPLEFINQQGAMKQADLDKHKKELSLDTDPLSKIGSLNAVLKTYDGKGNIVDTEYNKLEDIRRQSLYELSAEREQLASDLASGKISDSEFKAKAASHTKKAADIYNRLSGYKTEVDKINKYNEEFSKNKAYAQDPYYAQKALAYNTEFMKKGELANFAGVDIADTFDFQDAVKNFTFKDEGNQTVSLGDYIFKSGDKGVSKDRVQYAASQIFNNPTSKINQYVNMNVDHQLALYGLSGNEKEYPDGTKITIDKVYKDKDGKLVSEKIPVSYRQKLMADQAESFIQGAITEHAGIVHSEDARANPFAIQKRRFDKEDAQAKAAFEMSLQYVGADPSTSQNDNNMTRIAQSVTGSDNFEFRDGELHYNPVKEGTEYINVFGKNYDAKKAKADGAIEINGVKFAVTSGPNGQLNVMLPKGDGWEGVNYTIKTAGKNQGLLDDAKKINAIAKRLGYTGGDMKGNQKALESYMMDVYNLESTSTAFPVGLESWLSKEFGTNVDKDGNILNPAQLSNMTLKTADGQLVKGDSNTDEATIKANTLKGARISGFSKSLTNKNIKAGDLEITGNNGMRYILSTGKQNLKDASAASHRLLQSVNDWVMEGKKDHDYSELENNIRGILNVSKDAIHVTTQETAADGLVYTSFVFNNGGKLEKKVLVGDSKGNLVEKDPISLSEAARRMDSAGMLKHLSFYNKDATKRQEKDNSENIITEYEGSEE